MSEDFNWFLFIIMAVVGVLVLLTSAYLIVYYQHPDDKNQAWIPKLVVWLSLSLAIISVLLFPLDIANRGACRENIALSSCELTLPMRRVWFAVYISNAVLVFLVTPFTLFYYEGGSDRSYFRRVCGATGWVLLTGIVFGLVLGVSFAFVGFVEFPTHELDSGLFPMAVFTRFRGRFGNCIRLPPPPLPLQPPGIFGPPLAFFQPVPVGFDAQTQSVLQPGPPGQPPQVVQPVATAQPFTIAPTIPGQPGIGGQPITVINPPGAQALRPQVPQNPELCDATQHNVRKGSWRMRTTFPLYVVAICSTLGWLLFIVFGGIGLVALPVDLIGSFIRRPLSTISRSEYMRLARDLATQAKSIKDLGEELKKDEREHGRTKQWKKNCKDLNKQLVALEEEHQELEAKYPQGENGETRWVIYQLTFYLKLFAGIFGIVISLAWVAHVIIYMLLDPPLFRFLNQLFVTLDKVFPLFGTLAFSIFCFYLIAVTVKGHMMLGLDFGIFDLYPIRPNGTLMNSMLVNSALVLLSSSAVLQFCATAFPIYAFNTAIEEIFGNDIQNLMGIKYLYRKHVFLYSFISFVCLGVILLFIKRNRAEKPKVEKAKAQEVAG